MKDKFLILNVNIANIAYDSAVDFVLKKAIDREGCFFCFANAHMAVESMTNVDLANGLKLATLVFADGFPIAKSLKLVHNVNQERIAGMDFLPNFIEQCNKNDLKIFLFGSTKEVLDATANRISSEFPDLIIAGSISPPFNKELPNDEYIEIINRSGANVVFVALGCPKQEIWMAKNYDRISAPLLGIGGAIPVYAGILNRAPLWVQRMGFEWLYRLFQEPGRLWKRYLFTNSMFLFHIFKQWINVRTEKN